MKALPLFILLCFSCLLATNDNEAQILAARIDQNTAIAKGDIKRASSYWTDDVTLRRGLGHAVTGKAAYTALLDLSPNTNSILYSRNPELIEVSTLWPLAFESGNWTAARKGDSSALISGRYSAQWFKRDGRWLIRSEVFVALSGNEETAAWQALS